MAQYISCYIKLEMNRFQASLGYKMKTGVDKQNKIQLSNQTQTSNKTTNTTQNKIQLERRINKKIGQPYSSGHTDQEIIYLIGSEAKTIFQKALPKPVSFPLFSLCFQYPLQSHFATDHRNLQIYEHLKSFFMIPTICSTILLAL